MKPIFLIASLVLSTLVAAQTSRVVFENDKVRVLVVSYAPGEKTKMAEHQNALQIALTERKERLTSKKGGIRDVAAKLGDIERAVNGQYMTENLSSQFSDVLVVEFKADPANAASAASAGADSWLSGTAGNEASAVATLRTLNTSEITFASTYNQGFSDGLNRLGEPPAHVQPSADHADLVYPTLAGFGNDGTNYSFTKDGYRFTYTPGAGGFGTIASYKIIAEPVEHGFTGTRGFYTDQSAVLRSTSEKRPATGRDAPI
jgi:type IV pilus assembly protein PilA